MIYLIMVINLVCITYFLKKKHKEVEVFEKGFKAGLAFSGHIKEQSINIRYNQIKNTLEGHVFIIPFEISSEQWK